MSSKGVGPLNQVNIVKLLSAFFKYLFHSSFHVISQILYKRQFFFYVMK